MPGEESGHRAERRHRRTGAAVAHDERHVRPGRARGHQPVTAAPLDGLPQRAGGGTQAGRAPRSAGFLGMLMLDTRFPRPPGDAGHPASWRLPIRFAVVAGASPRRVVQQADATLLAPFVAAARSLVAEGAAAITTSCGFLVRWQRELQAALPVPVWSSSLLLLPTLPRPGVVTADAASLGAAELAAAGADPATPVEGLAGGSHLQDTLLHDRPTLDLWQAEADAVAAAKCLVARCPQVTSIVLECTNLPPYAAAIEQATGRPVHHLMTLVHRLWGA
ncbi:MAG: aspartate/glutamate racemase family protein [Rubrivivax sp.]|nr:aspartate/glutamate racemase family protein [Rubrivivax sp.]